MGQMIFDPTENWSKGAMSAPGQDLGPKGSFPTGENTILLHNTGGSAVVGQRAGWALVTATPQTASPLVIGQFDYVRNTGTLSSAAYHLAVGSTGRLDKVAADGTFSSADSGTAIPFTAGVYPPSFAAMNNLCFIANGVDPLHAFNGTDVWNAGLAAPSAPSISDGGAGNLPADDYAVKITFYDSATGLESSASPEDTLTLGASKKITVTWTAYAGEHPITATRVYLRQDSNQTEFFRVAEVATPTVTYDISLTQDQIDALTNLVPDEDEFDPPPSGLIGVEAHNSRLFAHDGEKVYFSQLGQPEAWDPEHYFNVNPNDGQAITALHSAHEVLLVFKRDALWVLYGEDPETWVPRLVDPGVGCLNERSVVTVEGTTYWWSEHGPMSWDGQSVPKNIALGKIDSDIAFEAALSTLAAAPNNDESVVGIVAAVDIVNQRVLWAAPEVNSVQNNLIFPYKYRFDQWEATRWVGIDAASLATVQDANSTPQVFLGGYKGQIFRYGGVKNDGTPSGTLSGDVSLATATTLTIASGTLLTTGGALAERYVTIHDGDGNYQRKRIASNTGTVITLASGEEFSPVPNSAWTWTVGAINFYLCLPWSTFGAPFVKKRLEYGYVWAGSSTDGAELKVELHRNYADDVRIRTFDLVLESTGLIWDASFWDEAVWGSGIPTTRHRKRVAKVVFAYKWAFRQFSPDTDVAIYKVDTRAETQTDRS
jgi:hypothetical protein